MPIDGQGSGPNNRLRESCRVGYPNAGRHGPNFAPSNALRKLGLPCFLPPDAKTLALSCHWSRGGYRRSLRKIAWCVCTLFIAAAFATCRCALEATNMPLEQRCRPGEISRLESIDDLAMGMA